MIVLTCDRPKHNYLTREILSSSNLDEVFHDRCRELGPSARPKSLEVLSGVLREISN
jgi:hypothetical protein